MTAELPCRMTGRVVHGDHRGRTIGFPTANLCIVAPASDLPVGVYAGTVDERTAMISIGVRPTFEDDGEKRVEVHLLDFSGDLYDREITVVVRAWLRAERPFAGVRELAEQLEMDAAAARLAVSELYGVGGTLVDDQNAVEYPATDRADEAFGDRVATRRPHRRLDDLNVK